MSCNHHFVYISDHSDLLRARVDTMTLDRFSRPLCDGNPFCEDIHRDRQGACRPCATWVTFAVGGFIARPAGNVAMPVSAERTRTVARR